jgi:hypothetical protein
LYRAFFTEVQRRSSLIYGVTEEALPDHIVLHCMNEVIALALGLPAGVTSRINH